MMTGMETASQRLHRLTSYEPGRDWDAAPDDPEILQDLAEGRLHLMPRIRRVSRIVAGCRPSRSTRSVRAREIANPFGMKLDDDPGVTVVGVIAAGRGS